MNTGSPDEKKLLADIGRAAEGLQLIAAELNHIRVLLEEETKRGGALDMRPLHAIRQQLEVMEGKG